MSGSFSTSEIPLLVIVFVNCSGGGGVTLVFFLFEDSAVNNSSYFLFTVIALDFVSLTASSNYGRSSEYVSANNSSYSTIWKSNDESGISLLMVLVWCWNIVKVYLIRRIYVDYGRNRTSLLVGISSINRASSLVSCTRHVEITTSIEWLDHFWKDDLLMRDYGLNPPPQVQLMGLKGSANYLWEWYSNVRPMVEESMRKLLGAYFVSHTDIYLGVASQHK